MTNDIKRGPLANALVLHDFQKDPINVKGWFYYVEVWFKKGGVVPNRISGRGDKNIGFEREKKKTRKEDFKSIQDGAWIGALPPKVGTEMFDFILAVHLDCTSPRNTLVLCWDDRIAGFERKYLESLVKDLSIYLEPAYGYGYQREFRYNPSFYPFGMTGGRAASAEEANQILKWQSAYSRSSGSYKTGMLRDIYPINFLSKVHLSQKVEETTLQSWIESSPDRGDLQPLVEDQLWSWWVPEEKISDVREKLRPTGMLICV